MSGYYQRNRDRPRGQQYRGQNRQSSGGGNYNRDSPYQRQSNVNRQMVNPWQSGMMPSAGVGMHAGGSDEAALAFNILNQVLATDSSMIGGQSPGGGYQDRKSRNMGLGNRLEDRRRTQSQQFSNRNQGDRDSRQWSNRSRSPQRSNSARRDSFERNRKPVMDRLGKQSDGNRRYSGNRSSQSSSREQSTGDKRKKSSFESRSSKSRERHISEDKKSEHSETKEADADGKEQDKNTKNEKMGEKKRLRDKENEEYVTKCLKCHICDIDTFESIESFRAHKRGEEHKFIANLYNNRSEAVLQLMRADAKLAANRDREKAGNANKEVFYARCIKCDCAVADAFKSHKKSIEHELVDNYLTRECCSSSFARRKEFEDHRLTLPHLKKQMESNKENEKEKKVVLAFTDEEETAATVLRELKEEHRMELKSPADFPDYEVDKPIGLSYVHKKRRFNCTVCKKAFPSYNTMALAHCRSFNHYLMLSSYLEKQLKEVEDDEVIETDEKKEDEEEEKKDEEEDGSVTEKGSTKGEDEKEEDDENDEMDNDNENSGDEDEDMGETLPPLEDGGIILEVIDKAPEDEEEEDNENEVSKEEDHVSSGDQDKDEGIPDESDTEDKVVEEMETEEEDKIEETPDDANDIEEEEVEVKPKAKQMRKGTRGKGKVTKGRGAKR